MDKETQAKAKTELMKIMVASVEERIEDVFRMADDDTPGLGKTRINWSNLAEVRWQICGVVADDLRNHVGDLVEDTLNELMEAHV